MRTNRRVIPPQGKTTAGAPAIIPGAKEALERSVLACMLFENGILWDGEPVEDRIRKLIPQVHPAEVATLAVRARDEYYLRHVPLLLVREMARYDTHKALVAETLPKIIQRADELGEFLAIYFQDNPNQPLSAQVKRGLSEAFKKFNEYELAKYDSDSAKYSLRDVLFLVHAKPTPSGRAMVSPAINKYDKNARSTYRRGKVERHVEGQGLLWKRLIDNELDIPQTWETWLSAKDGIAKRVKWETMLRENQIGGLALLRNLRNFIDEGVNPTLVISALDNMKTDKIFPFRFVFAALHAPLYAAQVERAMLRSFVNQPKLPGKSIIILDVSGSMSHTKISEKSDVTLMYAAGALGAIARELCVSSAVYATAGNDSTEIHKTALVPNTRGIRLVVDIVNMSRPLGGGGIFLKQVMDYVQAEQRWADRIIVITDERDCARSDPRQNPTNVVPFATGYMINVGSQVNTIANKKNWALSLTGFSENIFKYILAVEKGANNGYASMQ